MVNKKVKKELVQWIEYYLKKFLGEAILANQDYPKIINQRHFERLLSLLENQTILLGGNMDAQNFKIEPTILDNPSRESKVMNEEIFGPILPIIEYKDITEAIHYIHSFEKPLALYLFTNDKKLENTILNEISFGGGCINDTIIHIANSNIPFGGVGYSGVGGYHGKASFDTFSHNRSITKKFRLDLPMRYMPYQSWKDKIVKIFMKL